ncbi:glycosyltransferase family 2 protein [bacterium]|nr:glycosyltransferase family 2 protein [bacterium]
MMRTNNYFTSIIILNLNQKETTEKCVNSVLKQDHQNFEIIVVDNGSSDNSFEYLQNIYAHESKVKLYRLNNNLGFVGGNNFAFKKSSKSSQYCVFLNNDTTVEKDWLRELIKPLSLDFTIAAATAIEISNNTPLFRWGKEFITTNLIGINTFYSMNYNADIMDAFMIDGASFAFRKELVDIPFDEDFFAYREDMHLSWRFQLMKYRVVFVRRSIFYHTKGLTRKSDPFIDKQCIYCAERNRILCLLLFYELKTLLKVFPLILFGIATTNFIQPLRFLIRCKSYLWLLTNIRTIMIKRKKLQSLRKVSDKAILKKMSYQNNITYNRIKIPRIFKRIINQLFKYYCILLNIKTLEFHS